MCVRVRSFFLEAGQWGLVTGCRGQGVKEIRRVQSCFTTRWTHVKRLLSCQRLGQSAADFVDFEEEGKKKECRGRTLHACTNLSAQACVSARADTAALSLSS